MKSHNISYIKRGEANTTTLFLLVKCGVSILQDKMGYALSLILAVGLCFLVAVEEGVGLPTKAQVKGQCIY